MNSPKKTSDYSFYQRHGYLISKKLIPSDIIDELVASYDTYIKNSKSYFFRQNKNYWTQNRKNKYGFVKDSFLDPHEFNKHPEFRDSFRKVIMHANLRERLQEILSEVKIKLMQSMFFDLNTETWAHADNWYLDSIPNGKLLGVWIALEDIDPEAGQFYVVKNTNKKIFELNVSELISDKLHQKKVNEYISRNHSDVFKPELKKGDVVFWNSKVLHGSTKTMNPKLSRKSITGHFMPAWCEFGNIKHKFNRELEFKEYNGFEYRIDDKKYTPLTNIKTKAIKIIFNQFPSLVKLKRKLLN